MSREKAWVGLIFSVLAILLLSGVTASSAQTAPDWSGVSPILIATTDGPTIQTFALQTARVGDQVFFRVQLNYTGASDPGKVFFAVEFARLSNSTSPMAQGDEMIIASQKGPDGKAPSTYDYYIADTETQPNPISPGCATVESIQVSNSHYLMSFSRPMTTSDPAEQVQFQEGTPVHLAFAVSEWGLESSHSYTLIDFQMNITQTQVTVTPYHTQENSFRPLPTEVMMITPMEGAVEATVIFLVLFASILFLGTRRKRRE